MIKNSPIVSTIYQSFERKQWAELRNSTPLTLSEDEILRLKSISDRISLQEVEEVYLPLSRLLNLMVQAKQQQGEVQAKFLNQPRRKTPYIISIAGSVAVGKSTTARILQALLQRWSEHPQVDLVTTDGFIYPLATLKEKDLLKRKGFPESYDTKSLVEFVSDLKAGKHQLQVPVYSHITYDRCEAMQCVDQPDIVILEGLNVLQTQNDMADKERMFVSDFVDFSLFVDAEKDLLQTWYIERFLKLKAEAFKDPNSYFQHYAKLSDAEAIEIASNIWQSINLVNLEQNILPTRKRATLILEKGAQHSIEHIHLRQ